MRAVKQLVYGNWTIAFPITAIVYALLIGAVKLVRWLSCSVVSDVPSQSSGSWSFLTLAILAGSFLLVMLIVHIIRKPSGFRRRAASSLSLVAFVAVLFLTFQFGGWVRERSVGESSAAADATSVEPQPSLDQKLSELRANPSGSALTYFKLCPVDPSRRSEVVEALKASATLPDQDRREAANAALIHWRE